MCKTYFPCWKIWSWILINLSLMNSIMVLCVHSFTGIQPWFYDILHSTEFIDEFIIRIYKWLLNHESNGMNWWYPLIKMYSDISWYSSWSWIHLWIHIMNTYGISWSWIHMLHLMTNEFAIWIHVYEKYREIIYEIRGYQGDRCSKFGLW